MNWARERASEILNSIAFTADETREEIIAAELQRVADECANEARIARATTMDPDIAIRAKFPKEEM